MTFPICCCSGELPAQTRPVCFEYMHQSVQRLGTLYLSGSLFCIAGNDPEDHPTGSTAYNFDSFRGNTPELSMHVHALPLKSTEDYLSSRLLFLSERSNNYHWSTVLRFQLDHLTNWKWSIIDFQSIDDTGTLMVPYPFPTVPCPVPFRSFPSTTAAMSRLKTPHFNGRLSFPVTG